MLTELVELRRGGVLESETFERLRDVACWALAGYFAMPYWLMLGIAGSLLLGGGVLLLLQRERWDALRASVGRWWIAGEPVLEPLPGEAI